MAVWFGSRFNPPVLQRRRDNLKVQALKILYTYLFLYSGQPQNNLINIRTFYDSLKIENFLTALYKRAKCVQGCRGNIDAMQMNIDTDRDAEVRCQMEWHKNCDLFACIILFLSGNLLGAIIKKRRFGIAGNCFGILSPAYYILTEIYMQLALERRMPPAGAAMDAARYLCSHQCFSYVQGSKRFGDFWCNDLLFMDW